MNTTTKYIFEYEPFEPMLFQAKGFKELETLRLNDETQEWDKESMYLLNEQGRISTRVKGKAGWTAYPPLSDGEGIPVIKAADMILEEFVYGSSGDIIKKTITLKETGRLISTDHYYYDKGFLSMIKGKGEQTIYERGLEGEILVCTYKKEQMSSINSILLTEFKRNKNNEIVSRVKSVSIEFNGVIKETYKIEEVIQYHTNGQIDYTEILYDEKLDNYKVKTDFEYLNESDSLIKSITVFENNVFSKRTLFEYDDTDFLSYVKVEGQNTKSENRYNLIK